MGWTKLDAREVPAIAEADAYHVGLAVSSARYYSMEVVFQHYEVDTYYFPSAAPSMSSFPTVDEPRSVIGADAVASQVSTCYGGAASRAIDGNTAGNWNQGSVMHTCNNANPWWKVDLGRGETQITHVVVTSRTDCCNDRLRNTDLEILNASGTVVASRPFEGDKDVHHFRLGNNVMGRYVKLNKHSQVSSTSLKSKCLGHTSLLVLPHLSPFCPPWTSQGPSSVKLPWQLSNPPAMEETPRRPLMETGTALGLKDPSCTPATMAIPGGRLI